MNIYSPISRDFTVDMSPDGEVLIPEPIRRAAGLHPGMELVVRVTDSGEAIITTRMRAKRMGESAEVREARLRSAMDDVAGVHSTHQTTADAMNELRGDRPA